MTALTDVFVAVKPDMDRFGPEVKSKLRKIDASSEGKRVGTGFGKGLSAPMGGAGKSAAKLFVAGFALLKGAQLFGSVIEGARESARVTRVSEAVIKSTGGVAKISAKQMGELATSISNKTGADDEAIQSGQNLMATFTNVRNETGKGNDIFNQATGAAVDLASAMNNGVVDAAGLKTANVQLGKALNDPIKGVTALTKVGVSFTAGQKEQIKSLVASGNTMGAQKIILAEMQKEFGGAAAAAADPLTRLKTVVGNLGERVGGFLLPTIDRFANFLIDKGIPWIERVGTSFSQTVTPKLREFGAFLAAEVLPRLVSLGNFIANTVVPALEKAAKFVKDNKEAFIGFGIAILGIAAAVKAWRTFQLLLNIALAANPVGLVILAIAALAGGIIYAYQHSSTFRRIIQEEVLPRLREFGVFLRDEVLPRLRDFGGFIAREVLPRLVALGTFIVTTVAPVLGKILRTAIDAGKEAFKRISAAVQQHRPELEKLWNVISVVVRWIVTKLVPAIGSIVKWIVEKLGPIIGWLIAFVFKRLADTIVSIIGIIAWFVRVISGIINTVKSVGSWIATVWGGIKRVWNDGVRWIVKTFLNAVGWVLDGVVKMFGWVPGIGPKLKDAQKKFGVFKDDVNKQLAAIKDQEVKVTPKFSAAVLATQANRRDSVTKRLDRLGAGFWTGGQVRGPGTGTSDTAGVYALSDKEWVIKAASSLMYGDEAMSAVNEGRATIIPDGGLAAGGRPNKRLDVKSPLPTGAATTAFAAQVAARSRTLAAPYAQQIANDWAQDQYNQMIAASSGGGVWPVPGARVGTPFGQKGSRWASGYHTGTDFPAATGTSILAVLAGQVLSAGGGGAYGNLVKLGHAGGDQTWYAHMSRILAQRGAAVAAGQRIGQVGATGNTTGSHLHLELRRNGRPVDPMQLFGGGASGAGGPGVARWRGVALQALAAAGAPASWIGSLLRRMNQESGGNPRAVNRTDSNAAKGTPSMGLMQTIGPTFNRYAGPYRGRGIFDPFANIYASIKYANAQYGQAPTGWNRRGGYAAGGKVDLRALGIDTFDTGGKWLSGTLAANLSGKTETVRTAEQEALLNRPSVGQLTITNWETGQGYFRLMAQEEIGSASEFGAMMNRMG